MLLQYSACYPRPPVRDRLEAKMLELLAVWLLTWGAGLAMPVGALLARAEHIRPHWLENEVRHGIVAFGGGALLSAVALVLVPEGLTESRASLLWRGFWAGAGVYGARCRLERVQVAFPF